MLPSATRLLHHMGNIFRTPDFSELEEDIENTRQEVRDRLEQAQQRKLMHLVDTQYQFKAELA